MQRWTRRATDVDALLLADLGDLHCAELWLLANGIRMPAVNIGHVLVHDLTTGRFHLEDEDDFLRLHSVPGVRRDLEALIDATCPDEEEP